MTDEPHVEGMVERTPQKRGCLFWGCLIVFILLVVLGGLVFFGGYYLIQRAKEVSSPEPRPLPTYELKPGEEEALRKRLAEFGTAQPPARLELSPGDLNALITSDPRLHDLRGKVWVRIEGEEVFLDVSFPLKGIPSLSDRYFNGTIKVKLGQVDGRVFVMPEEAVVNGETLGPLPLAFLTVLGVAEMNKALEKLLPKPVGVLVQDGKVILTR